MLSQQTSDVQDGTGTTKSVLNAQKDGPLTAIKNALQLVINARHIMPTDYAQPVSKDTT